MSEKTITIFSPEATKTIKAPVGAVLADVLTENGYPVPAACGRRGTCGKCAVKLIDGEFLNAIPDSDGKILSCRAVVCTDATIEINFGIGSGLTKFDTESDTRTSVCGIAVDIGTTTVAAAFVDNDGTISTASRLNPQSAFGADVLSRISACSDGALGEMTKLIRGCVSELITELDPDKKANEMIVSGNTTMLHIFCSVSPEAMGAYPFEPIFTNAVFLNGSDLGFIVDKITVLPSASAFIGSDIISGIYALGLHKTDKRILLSDLGTNGELVLSDKGKLYCTSTAAGPALEGACIECGIGGVSGAIDSVFTEDDGIGYTTIGGASPIGICGAGLTDAVAVMLETNKLDRGGYLSSERVYITKNVYLSRNDIRHFQTAKSAVCSGIEALAQTADISLNDIDRICIAGGLGYHLNTQSAIATGLIPTMKKEKLQSVGNTSLKGATMCIGNPEAVTEMQKIAESCIVVDLGGNPDFSEKFLNNMYFPE